MESFSGASVLKSLHFPVGVRKDKGWESLFSNTISWAARAREQVLELVREERGNRGERGERRGDREKSGDRREERRQGRDRNRDGYIYTYIYSVIYMTER